MYILLILLLLLLLLLLLKECLVFFGLVFTNLVFKCKELLYGNTCALSKNNIFFIKKVLTLSKLEAILLTVDILIFNTQRSRL